MNFWDKNKIFEKLMILSWIGMLFFCLFLLSFTSHATSVEVNDYVIPYSLPEFYTNNSLTSDVVGWDNLKQRLWAIYDDQITNHSNFDWDNYIAYPTETGNYGRIFYTILFNPTIIYDVSDDFNFYQSTVTITYQKYISFSVYLEGSDDPGYTFRFDSTNYSNSSGTRTVFGTYDPFEYQGGYVQRYYPFILVGNDIVDSNGDVIITNTAPVAPNLPGTATEPHYDHLIPHHGNTVTPPTQVPTKPTYNNYTWITYNPPSIDTSSIEALLESLIDIVQYQGQWLGSNISNLFSTLFSNLGLWFGYVGDLLIYYFDLVIANIQNFIDNFYDNMVSLFEPIAQTVSYISEPVSGTVIYDNISGTSLITNITSINTALTSFKTSFDNLSEPSSFTIPIHLENLPGAYFGNQTTQYIDLSIIGSTEKGLIRTFMWAIITYSLFITIVDSVSNYINGGGDES